MAELNTNNKLNNAAGDLPEEKKINLEELPRDPEGKLLLDEICIGQDEKGNYIVPDEVLEEYYKELPPGTKNQSGTWRTSPTGGKLRILGGDPAIDKDIHYKGGKALQATLKQQRTFAEALNTLLAQKASKSNIEELELNEKADNLDVVIASMLKQAARGNVKAGEFIRDTIGQKPATEVNATVEEITPEDRELLQRVADRLDIHNRTDL